jgi:small GTP-binding protein
VVGDLAKSLFDVRQTVAAEVPEFRPDRGAEHRKVLGPMVVHPGAAAYFDGEQKTFIEQYGEWIYIGIMGVSLLGSLGAACSAGSSRPPPSGLVEIDKMLMLLRKSRVAETSTNWTACSRRPTTCSAARWSGRRTASIDEAVLSAFTIALGEVRTAIDDRRRVDWPHEADRAAHNAIASRWLPFCLQRVIAAQTVSCAGRIVRRFSLGCSMSLRNIAIIAHVDHGKTTLVDKLLAQAGSFRDNQRVAERVMDSNDLEKERGITILAKCTSLVWKDTRINIVDTPGHADFGGEVERILNMVDGVVVLVDAAEGPMPQTKFVVGKALKLGLRPIVAVNKVDRSDARAQEVINEVFDLFAALDANDDQLDFPILYGSGRGGWMAESPEGPQDQGLAPLFDLMLKHVPEASTEEGPFRMIGTMLEANPFLGRIITGKVISGSIKPNMPIKALAADGTLIEQGRVSKILAFRGIERTAIDEAVTGDIVAIAGLTKGTVADTFCAPDVTEPLVAQPIDPPTVSMSFIVNDSPLAGTEGDKVTSRVIRDRLLKEAEGNVALKIEEAPTRTASSSPAAANCSSRS